MAQVQIQASSDLFFSRNDLSSDKLHKVRVFMDSSFHSHNKRAVKKLHEVGGNCKLDLKNKKVLKGLVSNGQYAEIQMSRGIIEWHSHPSKCKNDEYCTVDTFSDADLINILLGSLYGTQVHLIYSGHCVWVVRVKLSVIDKLKNNPEQIVPIIKQINNKFGKLHAEFDKENSKMSMNEYRKKWVTLTRKFGFTCESFSNSTKTIGFELIVSEDMLNEKKPKIYTVNVSDKIVKKVDNALKHKINY